MLIKIALIALYLIAIAAVSAWGFYGVRDNWRALKLALAGRDDELIYYRVTKRCLIPPVGRFRLPQKKQRPAR